MSKRKVLEIFNMNKKNVISQGLIISPLPIFQLFYILFYISRDLLTQYLCFFMLRTMSSLAVPNFDSTS